MGETLSIILVYLLGMIALLIAAFRGFYYFYSKLGLYHKVPDDHDPVVELRNTDGIENPESAAYSHDITGNVPNGELEVCYSEEVENHDLDPQVVIDCEAEKKFYYGEQKWLKFARVWFYNGVTTLLTTALIIGYLQIIVDFFSLDMQGVPTLEIVIGVLTMISIIHLSLRLSSFLNLGVTSFDQANEFRDVIYNFAFSFNMSVLALWTVTFFLFMVFRDASKPPVLGAREVITVVGAAIVISCVISLLGEYLIRIGTIPEELMETETRAIKEITITEEDTTE